jgi:hypothetical protein
LVAVSVDWEGRHPVHAGDKDSVDYVPPQTCLPRGELSLLGVDGVQGNIGSASFIAFLPVRGFYLDACGDEDPGLKNGRLLNLSMDKLSQVQDLFMSEAWTDLLAQSLPLDHIPPPDSDLS